MVPFFTTTLCISFTALLLLVGIKRWELSTGRVVGAGVRPHVRRFLHSISVWIEHILPTLVRMYSKIIWRNFLQSIHKVTAFVVVKTEHALEHTLHTLRHTTDIRRGKGEKPSLFLREVSEHKRKLLLSQRATPLQKE